MKIFSNFLYFIVLWWFLFWVYKNTNEFLLILNKDSLISLNLNIVH